MHYNWFYRVNEELQRLGVDRTKCGVPVIEFIRSLWLEDATSEAAAAAVKKRFFPESLKTA